MTAEEMLEKGKDYLHGFGEDDKDYGKAIRYFFKALEAGSIKAMDEIGFMYQYGYEVAKNKSKAVKWYRCGAEFGDASSMNSLADCLLKGIGTDKDINEAIQWYRKAAESGNYRRVKELATCLIKYQGAEAEAYKWLKKGYDEHSILWLWESDSRADTDLKAMEELADIYDYLMPNTPENKLKAFEWREEMAERDARYAYNLAMMYWEGKGAEKNLNKALKWISASAEAGNNRSMSELAEIYLKGELVPKDEAKSLEWLTKAFEQNSMLYEEDDENFDATTEAIYRLANIYYADEDYSPGCDKSSLHYLANQN